MQLAFQHAVYLVDAIRGGQMLLQGCTRVTKVVHDWKRDNKARLFIFNLECCWHSDCLYLDRGARDDYISFVSLLADPRYCGISYVEKEEVISELTIRTAPDDVLFLLCIYPNMMEKLNEYSLWRLAALYCRFFCINGNGVHQRRECS
ncbi:hypothetical protein AMTR_s00025p00197020 [Amborella trichopoda]|uniref:Uncharacterized protein n=1 Tax=Amborella trichopoda TaxID=13333 RepID=W1PYF6_AMBTC|nr:hypothetical protein AMTR_s00025p00197020 [Amborella trichopoda]